MSNYDHWKTRSDRDDPAAQNHEPPADDDEAQRGNARRGHARLGTATQGVERLGEAQQGKETFSVFQFFADGSHERVRENVSAEEAVAAARHYSGNVAAQLLGIIEKVMIVDNGDYCCFLWERGNGVVFPPECRGRQ